TARRRRAAASCSTACRPRGRRPAPCWPAESCWRRSTTCCRRRSCASSGCAPRAWPGPTSPPSWAASRTRCASSMAGRCSASASGSVRTGRTMLDLLAKIRAEQRARWERGDRVLVEEYFRRYPDLTADEKAALDLICSEILLREEFGE